MSAGTAVAAVVRARGLGSPVAAAAGVAGTAPLALAAARWAIVGAQGIRISGSVGGRSITLVVEACVRRERE